MAAVVTASLQLSPAPAAAGDEAVLGTFETTARDRAEQGRPATFDFEPSQRPSQRDESRAQARDAEPEHAQPPPRSVGQSESAEDDAVSRLYADALDELEAGHVAEAQRRFEQVVAREPDSHLAKSARGYLADIYRTPGAPPAAVTEAPPAKAAQQPKFETPRSALGAGSILPAEAPPALVEDAPGFAVSPNIEEDFIVEAGDRVFFGVGSAELGQRARIVLAAQARWLSKRPDLVAVVEGHADDGAMPDEQSAKLSAARATAVRDRLAEEGVPMARLRIAGLGRNNPVADCAGPDCAAQNRRVVTVLKNASRSGHVPLRGPSVAAGGKTAAQP